MCSLFVISKIKDPYDPDLIWNVKYKCKNAADLSDAKLTDWKHGINPECVEHFVKHTPELKNFIIAPSIVYDVYFDDDLAAEHTGLSSIRMHFLLDDWKLDEKKT